MNTALVLALLAPAAAPAPRAADPVARGLKWLADQQKPDGSWAVGQSAGYGVTTARAGIALLMEGSAPSGGTYAPNVRKAVDWVEAQMKPDGHIAPEGQFDRATGIQAHAQCMLFLVCAYDANSDPARAKRLAQLIERAIGFAVACQAPNGGWGRVEPNQRANGTNGIQTCEVLHALLAARKVGFAVPRGTVAGALRWLETATNDDGSVLYTVSLLGQRVRGSGTPEVTASAAALALTGELRPADLPNWVRSARVQLGNSEQVIPQQSYFATQQALGFARVAHALGERGHERLGATDERAKLVWSRERGKLFKALHAIQQADGSWPDQYGTPALATAHALTILQLDNGYLSAFTR